MGTAGSWVDKQPRYLCVHPFPHWHRGTTSCCPSCSHLHTPPQVNAHYNRALCRNRNPYRWAEYAVSASIMQVMIAQLCGEWVV